MESNATPHDPFPKPPPQTPGPAPADGSLTGKRTVHTTLSLRPTGGQRMVPTQPAAEGDASVRVQSAPVAATLPASVARAQAQAAPPAQPAKNHAPPPKAAAPVTAAAPAAKPKAESPPKADGGLTGAKAFVAWLLDYGPFANRMVRRDAMPPLFPLALAVAGVGLLWPMLLWVVPADPGPVPVGPGFWVATFLKAAFLGPGVYFLFGTLVHVLLKIARGHQDFSASGQIALYAWLPYSLCQIAAVAFYANRYGEAYWRGYLPAEVDTYSAYASAVLLLWVGLRVASAAHASQGLSRVLVAVTMLVLPAFVFAFPPIKRFYHGYNQKRTSAQTMERAQAYFLARDTPQTIKLIDQVLADLGTQDGDQRASLWLKRGEMFLLQGKTTEARADFLRVAHRYPPDHALHATANAANFMALGHKDFALSSLRAALASDSNEVATRAWMTRFAAGDLNAEWTDLSLAEENARVWVRLEANPLSVRFLADILYRQDKHEDVLEALRRLPERKTAHAMTLYQGGMSAFRQGNKAIAAQLFEEAVKKDGKYAADPVVAQLTREWDWNQSR